MTTLIENMDWDNLPTDELKAKLEYWKARYNGKDWGIKSAIRQLEEILRERSN